MAMKFQFAVVNLKELNAETGQWKRQTGSEYRTDGLRVIFIIC